MLYDLTIANNNIVLLELKGDLIGQHQLNEITELITEQIADGHINYVVELSELRTINSTGLTILLTVLTKARNAGGEVVLTNLPEQLSKLLVITKLNAIFTIKKSVDEATEALLMNVEVEKQ